MKKEKEQAAEVAGFRPHADGRRRAGVTVASPPVTEEGIVIDISDSMLAEKIFQARLRLLLFANSHSLGEILQATLDEVEKLTGSRIGFYHFVEGDQRTLSLEVWSNRTLTEMCKAQGHGRHYDISEAGVWVDCIHQRRPVIHNDFDSLPHRRGMPEGHAPVSRELLVPICRDGVIVAIIGVGNKERDYDDHDVKSATLLADLAWDIAEHKRAHEENLAAKEKFERFFNLVPELTCIASTDGFFRKLNPAWEKTLGYKNYEMIGSPFLDFVHTDDVVITRQAFERAARGEMVINFTNRYRCKDGSYRWLEWRSVSGKDPAFVYAAARDVTERKNSEKALLESEMRYRRLFEVESDAIILMDWATGRFIDANAAALALYGYSREELLLLSYLDTTAEPEKTRQAITNCQTHVSHRLQRKKDGTVFPVEIAASYFDYQGRKVQVSAIRDITKRMQAEQELIERQKTISSLASELSVAEDRERCRIAGELHDRVAPKLLLARMKVNLLAAGSSPEVYENSIGAIEELIGEALEDIRSLTFQLRPPILAESGLETALKWLAEEFNEDYGLKIKIIDDSSEKPLKYEISYAIFQVVRELLLNVAKHANTQNAWISIGRDGDKIAVKVEDDGSGFNVADSSFNKPKSGGFGIFSTRMKIEYLGGYLSIDTSPGSGTRVSINAPLDISPTERE